MVPKNKFKGVWVVPIKYSEGCNGLNCIFKIYLPFQRYLEECVSDPSFGNLNLFSVSKLEKLADDGATQHPPFARINTPLVTH